MSLPYLECAMSEFVGKEVVIMKMMDDQQNKYCNDACFQSSFGRRKTRDHRFFGLFVCSVAYAALAPGCFAPRVYPAGIGPSSSVPGEKLYYAVCCEL